MGAQASCCSKDESFAEDQSELDREISEEERLLAEEEEERLLEEARRKLDQDHLDQDRLELAEKLRREGLEEASKDEVEAAKKRARAEKVDKWLKHHNFTHANDKKKATVFGGSSYPLHTAADDGDKEIVRGLLEARADHATKNWMGKTAIEIAQYKNYGAVVVYLQAAAYSLK